MKTKYYIPALLAGMLSLVGCKDNEPDGSKPANPQEGINFSIGQDSPNSRAHYSKEDWLQIEWVWQDLITIACDQTQAPVNITDPEDPGYEEPSNWQKNPKAEYIVDKVIAYTHDVELSDKSKQSITTNSKATIKLNSSDPKKGLYWSSGVHTFYASYGKGITINPSTGVAKCPYTTDQVLTYDEYTGSYINMDQVYMLACKKAEPKDGLVDLHFKPIMTTVEVDVQGPASGEVTIKAMEVIIPQTQDKIYAENGKTYFDYTITETGGSAKADTQNPTAEKIIFRLKEPVKVESGKFIKITAILPPVEISSDYPATISVYAEEGSSTIMFTPTKEKPINASAKAVITTSPWQKKSIPQEHVNLGLSVEWAKCNLGATANYECGDYYGWGCTIPYASSEYVNTTLYFTRLGAPDISPVSYMPTDCGTNKDPLQEIVINQLSIAGTKWDAANYRLGGKWRMPTQGEIQELFTKCTHEWTEVNGVVGVLLTSKTTSATSIFLPSTGGLMGSSIHIPADYGYYWSANPFKNDDQASKFETSYNLELIYNTGATITFDTSSRYLGFTIRPVWDENMTITHDIDPQGTSQGESSSGGKVSPTDTEGKYTVEWE